MFTTGSQDECLIKWTLKEENTWCDLDNLDYDPELVNFQY